MSLWTDITDFLGLTGNEAEAVATASTAVEVNPDIDITSLNVIDTAPLADALDRGFEMFEAFHADDLARTEAAEIAEAGAAAQESENSRLILPALGLGLALLRKI